jgi:hypothetical protein
MDQIRETPPSGDLAGRDNAASNAFSSENDIRASAPERQAKTPVVDEIEREFLRDEVFEAAGEALNYLVTLRGFIASDDQPGLKYSYAKFVAYTRIGRTG